VLGETSTERLLQEHYPLATLVQLQGSTARLRGVQGVLQGRFDSFVSDGILLLGQVEALQTLGLQTGNYAIVPDVPLSCDHYGLLLPNDSQWESFVNSLIGSDKEREIWRDWFEPVLPRIEKAQQNCNDSD